MGLYTMMHMAGLVDEVSPVAGAGLQQLAEVRLPPEPLLHVLGADASVVVVQSMRARHHERATRARCHGVQEREHLHAGQADLTQAGHVEVPDLVGHRP